MFIVVHCAVLPAPTFRRISMFGTYARNVIAGQSRYYPSTSRAELVESAMKSEQSAKELYADLNASRAFCDDMIGLKKSNPNKTWREILFKFKSYLSDKHPHYYIKAIEFIGE